jgi:REP element-mobilizing transposase RayT
LPVYLFTFHAYRSWLPDRKRGYVRRHEGILPTDIAMAQQYARNAKRDEVKFDRATQEALVAEVAIACKHQRLQLHAVTTEPTHVHPLVSWRDIRPWLKVRTALKTSLSLRLKELTIDTQSHLAFSRSGSRKRVNDEAHLDYLMTRYLPAHTGAQWIDPTYIPLKDCPQK